MKLKKLILLTLLLATTGMVFVTACKKDPIAYNYELILSGANEPHALVLDKFTSRRASVSCAAEWITATASEETVSGYPILVVVSSNTTNQLIEAIVKVKSENGELAEVRVRQGVHVFGDAYLGENMEFITNWENCDTVRVNGEVNPVATPWVDYSQSNIPYEIRKQCKKADGWEMAFCSLNNTATPKICFFALYNKWSGILRVFHYIADPTGYGNEMVYAVWMGGEHSQNNAPYYNSLEYGIPSNHEMGTSLTLYADFIGGLRGMTQTQSQSFMTWVTPSQYFAGGRLYAGWYGFAMDTTR